MSRKMFGYKALLASGLLAATLTGCGSDKKGSVSTEGVGGVATVSESACAQCHSTAIDPVAGTKIYDAYLGSLHYKNNFRVVGCQDCHGGGSQHNGVGPLPYANPDAAGKCFECHKNYLPASHYYAMTTGAGTQPAMYASKNYQTACTACHDPHLADNGITTEHVEWAESGHGNVNGLGWANRDFKNYDATGSCTPCHSSTGFINYVKAGYVMPTASFASATDYTREVLTCGACHTSYNFESRVRNMSAVKAMYTYGGSAITFPNVGYSNLCTVCHSGRGNVDSARSTRFQGHHAPAAAVLFSGKSHVGYEFAGRTYTSSVVFAHDKLGTSAFPATGSHGPCVACHMQTSESHKFEAVTKNSSGNILTVTSGVCAQCHAGIVAADLEELRVQYQETGTLLKDVLANTVTNFKGIKIALKSADADVADPYYYKTVEANIYGAVQNSNLTTEEAAAYVHNSVYAKRLLFDSIFVMINGAFVAVPTISIDVTKYPNAAKWFGWDGVTAGPYVASRP